MIPNLQLNPSTMDAKQIVDKLNALEPAKAQIKTVQFREIYPEIERTLSRSVPQKAIVSELAKMGLPLSLGGFRSLLDAERKRRAKDGEVICCERCGAPLSSEIQAEANG
jgi:hypothetical protein